MSDTKTVSLDQLRAMRADGDISAGAEQRSADTLPDDFWDDAEVVMPKVKKAVSLRVDQDVLDFFKDQGAGHLTRMHAVLRAYVDAKQKRRST